MGTMNVACKIVKVAINKLAREKFLVQYVDPRAQLVYTWGHVIHYVGLRMTHGKEEGRNWKAFRLDDVEIDYVSMTRDLVKELFEQTLKSRERAGHFLVRVDQRTYDMGPGLISTQTMVRRLGSAQLAPLAKGVPLSVENTRRKTTVPFLKIA